MIKTIVGKNHKKIGKTPSIALVNPKYPHNVGSAIRAASCFGAKQVFFTGNRIDIDGSKTKRIPREERMKGYGNVETIHYDYFFDLYNKGVTPVAVELRPGSEMLTEFEHPENPLYVFGPEDGSIPAKYLSYCHRFVVIPTKHCVNLSAAIYLVLYDRLLKQVWNGDIELNHMDDILCEQRGWPSIENHSKLASLDEIVENNIK